MSLTSNTPSPAPAPAGHASDDSAANLPPAYVLTTRCPDTTGIVAAVSGFLAANQALITEAQHYDDPYTDTSFMRTVFHDNGLGMPPVAQLDREFAVRVADRFGMTSQFHEVRRKCRVILAVSKQGTCLN